MIREVTLTSRQSEVLKMVALGHKNTEIASTLGLAQSTADKHIQNMFDKLGVNCRVRAVVMALKLNIVKLADI